MLPYSTQTIEQDDLEAVRDVLTSGYLTCGPLITEFEDNVADYCGAQYAVGVNSCTSALHLAMIAFGVQKDDYVYVSAISFVASANCARYLGANVEFIDVDKFTGNLNVDALEQMLIKAKAQNKLPKVVVAVHLSGKPVDLERLSKLKAEYGFYLLEDAAHAFGAEYHGSKIGSCKYSDITVFSFHPVKIITTAEGGMCLTNNEKFYQIMKKFSSHGIEHDKAKLVNQNYPAYYYEMQDLGFNYRLSDLQAALGISQLNKVDDFLAKRREQAKAYGELLKDQKGLVLPIADTKESLSSWHLYQVSLPGNCRDHLYEQLRKHNIGVQIHYLPIYDHPYYQSLKTYEKLDGAEYFFSHTLSIPLFPKLSHVQLQMCAATLCSLLDKENS